MRNQYDDLYALQDTVLNIVFAEPTGFYLTGGTALSRFYLHHRYSDALDFFTHDVNIFSDVFRIILEKIQANRFAVRIDVDARDFKRLRIDTETDSLKLDFVADRVPRIGIPARIGNFTIDTVRNILSNKICAVIGRDEGRDIVDLIFISLSRTFFWEDIIKDVSKKAGFSVEEFIYRLRSFPLRLLADVPLISPLSETETERCLLNIAVDVENFAENSLASKDALPL